MVLPYMDALIVSSSWPVLLLADRKLGFAWTRIIERSTHTAARIWRERGLSTFPSEYRYDNVANLKYTTTIMSTQLQATNPNELNNDWKAHMPL